MIEQRVSELMKQIKYGGFLKVHEPVNEINFNINIKYEYGLLWYQITYECKVLRKWFRLSDDDFYNWLIRLEERN